MRVLRAGRMGIDYTVQRRRRKKAAPKNIFGSSSQTSSKARSDSIPKPKTPKPRSPRAAPPSAPGSRPKPVPKPKPSTIKEIEQDQQNDSVGAEEQSADPQIAEPEETILEDQILGVKKLKRHLWRKNQRSRKRSLLKLEPKWNPRSKTPVKV